MKYTFVDNLSYYETKKKPLCIEFSSKSPSFDLFWKMADKGLLEKKFPLPQKGYIFGGVYKWSFTVLHPILVKKTLKGIYKSTRMTFYSVFFVLIVQILCMTWSATIVIISKVSMSSAKTVAKSLSTNVHWIFITMRNTPEKLLLVTSVRNTPDLAQNCTGTSDILMIYTANGMELKKFSKHLRMLNTAGTLNKSLLKFLRYHVL